MSTRTIGLSIVTALALAVAMRLFGLGGGMDGSYRGGERGAAPDFTLPLLGGGEFHLAASPPSVTLIDFWATWCAPCREELPHIDALHRRYKDRGVRFVAVNVESPEMRPAAERLAGELKLELPIALDGAGVAEKYKVDSLPHVLVVDRSGRASRVLLGVHSEDKLAALVEDALK